MKAHFIGIGGIGVSALAQYYLSKGHEVSGSDLAQSEITDFVKQKGAKVTINSKIKNQNAKLQFKIQKFPDLVIYSPAVKGDNPELKFYRKRGIECLSYPQALGKLTEEYYTIAVAGAHGKSTTTAMLGLVLAKAGLDPTVIVGTKVKEFGNSNFRAGRSPDPDFSRVADPRYNRDKILVIEACEYDSSFLYYSPKIIVVTNVDKEHLDYFHNLKNIIKAFRDFMIKLPNDGFLVANSDDKNIFQIINPKFKIINYGLEMAEAKKIKKIMKMPGKHNVSNALAALQVARILEVPDEIIFDALSEFRGTWRRFEERVSKIKKLKNLKIISDYAHHPNEIIATLGAAREKYKNKRILCVFQPHQHQRTHYLFNDFVKVFRHSLADFTVITDIYDVAGRETKKINKKINSQKLVEIIKKDNVIYCATKELEKHIKKNIKPGDVLIIMGAGDIYNLADKF